MKNYLLRIAIVLGALMMTVTAQGVLKEKNFQQTLNVLRAELEQNYLKQKVIMATYEQRAQAQHDQLILTMQKCNQISLILYSQKEGFTFDMAYACQQATDIYKSTKMSTLPYDKIRQMMSGEIERYDLLINTLEELPPSLKMQALKNKKKSLRRNKKLQVDTTRINMMLERLDSIALANGEDPFVLNESEEESRNECIIYAKALRNNMARMMTKMDKDVKHYERISKNVEDLNNYALKKYETLRQNIFNNRGDNYLKVLMRLPKSFDYYNKEISEKYSAFAGPKKTKQGFIQDNKSQWRGKIIPLTSVFIFIYVFISSVLSYVIIRWLLPNKIRSKENFKKKEPVLLVACGFIIFMISVSIIRNFLFNNFLIMSTGLLLEFSWLVVFILLSLLFRLNGDQIKEGTKQYTPFLLMAFIVIAFRIVFIPNNTANLIFPPIILLFTIWQGRVLRKRSVNIPGTDLLFSGISLVALILACVLSFIGYTLLAVEVMIWWTFQLASIQTILFFYDISRIYEKKYIIKQLQKQYKRAHGGKLPTTPIKELIESLEQKLLTAQTQEEKDEITKQIEENTIKLNKTVYKLQENIRNNMAKGEYIDKTYFFDLINIAIIPITAVVSVLLSLYMAADLFDMNDLFLSYLSYNFIDTSFLKLSIIKICFVISLFFVFKYVNYAGHALYKSVHKKRIEIKMEAERKMMEAQGVETDNILPPSTNTTLANNIITILVWGSYFIFILYMLNVPKSGITIITTGLATGMGFAMKDLLENFFYGLSLMTGRIRIGDFIECDGIAGKVDSITYQSTQIVTNDGCVIAFLNSQLFTKNFKNLTRNHKYELIKVPIGVSYGTNVQEVRELLINSINQLIDTKKENSPNLIKAGSTVKVSFSDFGDSSVNLTVLLWVLVEEKIGFMSEVKENIYNTLNQHNIEIPFPQQDIHIRDTVNLPISTK